MPTTPPTQAGRRGQTRLLLWGGFGGLLLLMLALGSSAVSFLYQVEIRQRRIREDYVSRDRTLERLRSGIYLSGTYVRDYLLDPADPPASMHRAQFDDVRRQIEASLPEAAVQLPGAEPELGETRKAVADYLAETSAVFDWPPSERARRSYGFMRDELLPGRMQLLGFTDRLRALSERQLEMGGQSVSALLASYRLRLLLLSILACVLGAALAGATLSRILKLESEARHRLEDATSAREELARLSADLVAAQENERRNISRELHDEVGQTLYAAVLSIGNLRSALEAHRLPEGLRELQLVSELTGRTARVVRNLALLLRPAMLDDLGLLPALKWHAREVTRTQSIPVEVEAADDAAALANTLPDDHVTCVYRIVQESVHNAQKHSHAQSIRVDLENDADGIAVRITDDGRGFEPGRESGLGILGMKERATRLGGSVAIESRPGRGTSVVLRLPAPHAAGVRP